MCSINRSRIDHKPHAVCIPFPTQGHMNPMLKLAKILNKKEFHITYVNTEFNHDRLRRSRGPESLQGRPSFRFETIPDGLPPPSETDTTRELEALCKSTSTNCLGPFKELLARLNDSDVSEVPPVTCIVSDGVMSFTAAAAEELGIPEVLFWTCSACGLLGYMQYPQLIEKGYTPLKDESYLTNGYLETKLDWIEGMRGIRLRDLPTFFRTTNPDEYALKFVLQEIERAKRASAILLNTFDDLEHETLTALQSILPPIYSIGPLHLLEKHVVNDDDNLRSLGSNLWEEDTSCLDWLDTKPDNSVVYVSFGSITVITPSQLAEFAWGLASCGKPFLWIVRPDLVSEEKAILPPEFVEETRDRGMLTSWCPQEQVLGHRAVSVFLTHCEWNSTLESISKGVLVICWPFCGEQQKNCWFSCDKWGIGMEIDSNVKRGEIETVVKELMDGEKGKEMKRKTIEWKKLAEEAVIPYKVSSYVNIENVINHHLIPPKN